MKGTAKVASAQDSMAGRRGGVAGWGGAGTGEAGIANLKPHRVRCEIPQPMIHTWVN